CLDRTPLRTRLAGPEERRPAQPVAQPDPVGGVVVGRNLGEPEIATREDAEARRACCLVAQRQRRTRLRQHELAPRLPHRPVRRRLVVPLHEILRTLTPRDPNRLLEAQRRRLASTL